MYHSIKIIHHNCAAYFFPHFFMILSGIFLTGSLQRKPSMQSISEMSYNQMIWAYGDKPLHLMQWFHFFLYWVSVWLLVCITFYYYYYYFDGCFVWKTIWVIWREYDDLRILLMIKGWTKDTLNPKLMKFIPHHICSLFMNEIHHIHIQIFIHKSLHPLE